jgi:hypothetical protein
MTLTRDASELTVERIQCDRNFAMALFGEAIAVFLNGGTGCVPVVAAGFGEWDDRL